MVYRSGFYDSFQNYTPDYDEIPMEKLKRERSRLINKFGDQAIEIKALYGDPVSDLIRTAENSADLVVIGEEQFTGWSYQKMSKVKTAMIHLEIPLILVPEMDSFEKIEQVVLIQENGAKHGMESMELIRRLCRISGVRFQTIILGERQDLNNTNRADERNDDIHFAQDIDEINVLLKDTIKTNAIVVSNIEYQDSRFSDSIGALFKDNRITQTKLLMPEKSIENFLRGA